MWKTRARVSAIGLEMAIAIAIGYGIGWWHASRYDTKPRYMIIFLLIGVGAGFRGLIRVAQEERARQRKASKEASAAAPQEIVTNRGIKRSPHATIRSLAGRENISRTKAAVWMAAGSVMTELVENQGRAGLQDWL